MTDPSQFNQVVIFEDVAIGRKFIEGFSDSDAIYERVEQFDQGEKTFNGRRVAGPPHYKRFVGCEPVFVETKDE